MPWNLTVLSSRKLMLIACVCNTYLANKHSSSYFLVTITCGTQICWCETMDWKVSSSYSVRLVTPRTNIRDCTVFILLPMRVDTCQRLFHRTFIKPFETVLSKNSVQCPIAFYRLKGKLSWYTCIAGIRLLDWTTSITTSNNINKLNFQN